jgi:hypothetical protein
MERRKEGFEFISVFNFPLRSQQAVSRGLRKFTAQGSADISQLRLDSRQNNKIQIPIILYNVT